MVFLQNILTFTPPGFPQALKVKFPDSRLAVCEKCKKNFKTRDVCRVRNNHNDAPWTTAYICITIDDTCTDENNKFLDKPMTLRMVQWQPFAVQRPFDPKTPVCASCKKTNRTRNFCRERHKHRHLPWCTVYVLMSAVDQTDPDTIVAGSSVKVEEEDEPVVVNGDDDEEKPKAVEESNGKAAVAGESKTKKKTDFIVSEEDDAGDDINEIPKSRTFLARVSAKGSSIHWLDLSDFESDHPPLAPPAGGLMMPMGGDHHTAAYYDAHRLHQQALQANQQFFYQAHQQQQHQQQQPRFGPAAWYPAPPDDDAPPHWNPYYPYQQQRPEGYPEEEPDPKRQRI